MADFYSSQIDVEVALLEAVLDKDCAILEEIVRQVLRCFQLLLDLL